MRSRLWLVPFLFVAASCPGTTPSSDSFAERIQALSGPGGYFDTDNLISNERSYLHAISDLRNAGIKGGVYLGVGPDQNFSYIAEIQPELAILVDVRSDNILQHLIYKALFHASRNRLEYLALLTGRHVPPDVEAWTGASLDSVLAYVSSTPGTEAAKTTALEAVRAAIAGFGVQMSAGDLSTIARFHEEFIADGVALRFRSHGRAPQFYYPTYDELAREVDREGQAVSYLATEERWLRVRDLQLRNRIIPIVGDLGGEIALRAVAEFLEREGLEVSAFYTSNVEFYLFGDRTFGGFIENLRVLPLAPSSVVIKSFFRGFRGPHPLQVPNYYSTQLVQDASALVEGWDAGRYRSYWEVVTEDLVGPIVAPRSSPVGAVR